MALVTPYECSSTPVGSASASNTELEDAGIVADAILTYLKQGQSCVPSTMEAVAQAQDDAVEQVLLQNGYCVWLAYHMATKTGSGVTVRAAASRLTPPALATIASIIKALVPGEAWTRLLDGRIGKSYGVQGMAPDLVKGWYG